MKLAVVEVLDRDGHARTTVPVLQWPVTVGRAVTCDVVLDDAHAAPLHATLVDADGVLMLVADDTVNGVRLGGRRLAAHDRVPVPPGGTFVVGATSLRVRRVSDPLPEERRLSPALSGGRLTTLTLIVIFTSWSLVEHWLSTDPGGRATDHLVAAIGAWLVLATWSGFWAVGSKLVQHRFDFWAHVRTASGYAVGAGVVALVLPLLSYASGWTTFSRISGIVAAAVAWAMVLAHLRLMLPTRARMLTAVMSALFVAGVSVQFVHTYQTQDRLFNELYVTMLGPPAVRVAPAVGAGRFIDEARALEAVLTYHAADDEDDEPSAPLGPR